MSRIEISQPHQMSLEDAHRHVDALAAQLSERFGLSHAWDGHTLNVNGSGLTGTLALTPEALDVAMELGFPLSMMQAAIETRLRDSLHQHFGAPV